MIVLKSNENIEVYQVELVLKVKTKQSPFIAVLILAKELYESDSVHIDSGILRDKLLPVLPLKACQNILERLCDEGYFEEVRNYNNDLFKVTKEDYLKSDFKSFQQNSDFVGFLLTELGEQSATDKSFWIGEKGVYDVFVSKLNLFEQKIIKIEKATRAEDHRNNEILNTPRDILKYEKQVLLINKSEVIIEDVGGKCFNLNSLKCDLEIISNDNETTIKISNNNQNLFNTNLELDEVTLQEKLLSNCNEFEYDQSQNAILIDFNKDDISFNRKVKISKPVFNNNTFDPIELQAMLHIPSDNYSAELWYSELLFKNINQYYLDEDSFSEYANSLTSPIDEYYDVDVPDREDFLEQIKERTDAFYQIAKIETIDYLNY